MTFTTTDVVAKVRELAKAHPGAVYEPRGACAYTGGEAVGAEGCLIGQALRALGVPREALAEFDELEHVPSVREALGRLGVGPRGASGEARVYWLHRAQGLQDGGRAWGAAVKDADANYPLR